MQKMNHKLLFEVSWEVCNKVGGIYTVITSKLEQATAAFGKNYFLIGPLLDSNPGFVESNSASMLTIKHKLDHLGILAKVGYWDLPEKPAVILVPPSIVDKDKILFELWEEYGVDSMTGGWDYIEPVSFANHAGRVIEAISDIYDDLETIAHFHEWMTGSGLLYLRKYAPHISTVFTTHATILGRSIAGNGIDLYRVIENINPDSEAARFNILAKYSMEKICAHEADSFTTVSDITAMEAKNLLNVPVDQVLPNGFDMSKVPDYQKNPEHFKKNRKRLLEIASKFLQKDIDEENAFILSTSGRYEYRNKGLDVLLDAIARIKKEDRLAKNKELIVFMFVLAGSNEANNQSQNLSGVRHAKIATHPLWNQNDDPIVKAANQHNLLNGENDKINLIFIPIYLDGRDRLIDMEYYDALSGCDLAVFASYYEPWGYTPLESVAFSIPTITTDLAGFGLWVNAQKKTIPGVHVIKRYNQSHDVVVNELSESIMEFINRSNKQADELRPGLRELALQAEWANFYPHYLTAYTNAEKVSKERFDGHMEKSKTNVNALAFSGTDSTKPRLRNFTVKSSMPKEIQGLRDLAFNLWWAWNPVAHQLFNRLDPDLYDKLGNNPVSLIETIDPQRLQEVIQSENYLHFYEEVMNKFNKYMSAKKSMVKGDDYITPEKPVAYFSMEFGFHESIPIYSGGLGILSGDHIKSASDMNIPLIGVGLLYRKGYFMQGIGLDGNQKVEYFHNDFHRMPIHELRKRGKAVLISIDFPGREVFAKAWVIQVGRIQVYMLDTDILENSPADRLITSNLYGGGKKNRIEQELILGIGGVKLLQELNITPSVYHLNEGHSAFLIIQRFINQIKYNKLDFDTAKELIRSSTVFTTHTPVPAGNEVFDYNLVENYLRSYVEANGLSWKNFNDISGRNANSKAEYEMTILALTNTFKRNGVSKLHGVVSRKMWSKLWPGFLQEEVPISHITNGIHLSTWLSSEMRDLFDKYQSIDYQKGQLNKDFWEKINKIPEKDIWHAHNTSKERFFSYVKEKVTLNWTREGEEPAKLELFLKNLDPTPLTIGFARRFATYKRATLLFKDFDRLKKILLNPEYPVQLVFAGKAHPDDLEGARLIKEIVAISKMPEFLGKIIFLEDYNIKLARKLVSGVDVWLNNPIRPNEASGTSGMKAGINGVINCSILDGWWDEAYDSTNGWAIGEQKQYKNTDTQNIFDSESFYDILENEIVASYYNRNNRGVPVQWVEKMKRSMITILGGFNTHRMLNDYFRDMYLPTASRYALLSDNSFEKAKSFSEWLSSIRNRFASIHINTINLKGGNGDVLNVNDVVSASIEVHKGKLTKEEISAQLIIIKDSSHDSIVYGDKLEIYDEYFSVFEMQLVAEKEDVLTYSINYVAQKSGKFNYGMRVLPKHPDLTNRTNINLIYWA